MAPPTHPATPLDRKALSGPALRTFCRIAALWRLSEDEQRTLLGLTSRSTLREWKRNPDMVLPKDTLERISCILGVYKALQPLLPDEKAADAWVRRPNSAALFAGHSALDKMLSGKIADLFIVRQYLGTHHGGWV
ncbi:MbcA/ParS/Xre antitoxin family protein [Marinimicrococcus flavescens]|uniref:MbcA/ParS/Xre antitoxin family protein n=1 Tax=Marinimicrococcus flavescens TaxID=3031815 RepID=A0AAP3XS10_9PROT|nr:MbcA/ParS/Xre antitoxin family protein [Marinimicrococcus flavescens]